MAGDWIKMRCDLRSDPAVFKLAELTSMDRFCVVGRLHEFWSWIDRHAVDGRVDGGTSTAIDDVVAHVGFADALVKVKWLSVDGDGVYIPKHEQHNGDSSKDRNLKSERQARWRAKKAAESVKNNVDGGVDATPSTREEKRREEKKTTSSTPSAKPTSKAKGSKRVPAGFEVSAELQAWAIEKAPQADWRAETEKFRDWEFQHARTDWDATWRTWMRNAQTRAVDAGGTERRQESFV